MENFFVHLIELYSENLNDISHVSHLTLVSDTIISSCGEILRTLYANDLISEIYTYPIKTMNDDYYKLDYEITSKRYNLKYLKAQIDILFHFIEYIDSFTIWEDLVVYDTFYVPIYKDFIEKYNLQDITYKYKFINQFKKSFPIKPIERIKIIQ